MLLAAPRRDRSRWPQAWKITVPGAPKCRAIALAARSGRFCAFVALGVVIRGETFHFEIVAQESTRLLALTLDGFAIGTASDRRE